MAKKDKKSKGSKKKYAKPVLKKHGSVASLSDKVIGSTSAG
jgi:hypothetical protein